MNEGNFFAYFILAVFPLIMIRIYQIKTIQIATLWTILGGFMLLPVKIEVDLPFIPPLGKDSIPVLAALIGCWVIKGQRIQFFANKGLLLKGLVLLIFIVPFATAELNGDKVILVGDDLPGLTHYDGFSLAFRQFLFIAPFFIGRRFFRTYEHQLLMFKILVAAGLLYSLPVLLEIRLSPQLHTWIYGYFPHSFNQQMRQGGFRPVVFMGHGLLVSFFIMIVLTSATVLWKNKEKVSQFPQGAISYYLLAVLVLCKGMASSVYGVFAFFVIKKVTPKTQLRIAVILVTLALLYPTMSMLKVFPHQKIADIALSFDAKRANSLVFRFENEDILLERARKRLYFGWGGFGRNRVYNVNTGKDESVTDGRWIITFGQFGWIGFIAEFGLLAMVVFRAYAASKAIEPDKELRLLTVHALLLSLIIIDQLPNASLAPWLWLLAGILLGRTEDIVSQKREQSTVKSSAVPYIRTSRAKKK